ncbi:hypothetical protein DCC81_03610 [Chitinophaga parva]|uniref:Uncharacterized protein n=1 Tax=Chitinophaga parva TaxID=2169414 RepID=A0A2T7BLS1_9BACT|nr:hypothetical protein [Chitinophaga parva]PUZ28580.1 hypothetical protein DCC81_03610 [Chitinophaga parva]
MEQKMDSVEKAQRDVFFSGFGEQYHPEIAKLAKREDGRYAIEHKENLGRITAAHDLEFGVKAGQVFYNGQRVTLTDNTTNQGVSQWFPAPSKITKTEGQQLLWDTEVPRAVQKTYVEFNDQAAKPEEKRIEHTVWLQLDFKHKTKHDNFRVVESPDFNMAEKLGDFVFKPQLRMPSDMGKAIETMKKGGEIEIAAQDGLPKVFISANPSRGTFHIRDEEGTLLKHDQFRTEAAKQADQARKEGQNQGHVDNPGQTPMHRYNRNPREMSPGRSSGRHQ